MTATQTPVRCPTCHGCGYTVERSFDGVSWQQYACYACDGTGEAPADEEIEP